MHISIERVFAVLFVAASLLAQVAARATTHLGVPESPLQAFYLQGFAGTLAEASVFLFVVGACFGAYAFSESFRTTIQRTSAQVDGYLRTCSLSHYALISFCATATVLFLLNAPGILYGTFMIDDYKMYAIATESSAWDLVWTPINDHVIPLFWLELKALFAIIGAHPPFLNFPLFLPAVLAIGGIAVLLRQLKFGPDTLFIFLGLFATTTIVSHQLYGFYAVAPYFQVLATFVLSLIFFVKAQEGLRFTHIYQTLSFVLVGMSLLIESGGVWTPVAYTLFIYAFHILQTNKWGIRGLLRAYAWQLFATSIITFSYLAYLVVLPRYTTESFFGFSRLPISFDTIVQFYHVLTAGTLLSLFAPRLGLVVSQPRLLSLIVPWHVAMFVLFCAFTALVIYTLRKGTTQARVLVPYFTLVMCGTALLVAIARPSSNPAAFFRDQNLLFPLFFLAIALTTHAHEWVRSAPTERIRHARTATTIAFLAIVFVAQHVFSFYKQQYVDDLTFNQSLTSRLQETLVPALNELSASSSPLVIPSLGPLFLNGGFHQLPPLADFSSFIGINNVQWLPMHQGPYIASTSPLFIEALTSDDRLRAWYLANGEIPELCTSKISDNNSLSATADKPVRIATTIDPERAHILHFDLEARDASEKIFVELSFKNDFSATGTRAYIRLDQYTKRIDTPERRYACTVDLNEIPAFALSKKVRNITFTVTSPGEYHLNSTSISPR
ncbi:MAG: hypothetical protein AAB421_03360 [Patescibacteria group bacterium]